MYRDERPVHRLMEIRQSLRVTPVPCCRRDVEIGLYSQKFDVQSKHRETCLAG